MPSVFHNHFEAIGFPLLLTQFGESVTYNLAAGGSRTFDAIINREVASLYEAAGGVVSHEYEIRFLQDDTTGMLPSEINTGGDTVELTAEIGDVAASTVTVLSVLSTANGSITLALR